MIQFRLAYLIQRLALEGMYITATLDLTRSTAYILVSFLVGDTVS